jgi:hypothetical protein
MNVPDNIFYDGASFTTVRRPDFFATIQGWATLPLFSVDNLNNVPTMAHRSGMNARRGNGFPAMPVSTSALPVFSLSPEYGGNVALPPWPAGLAPRKNGPVPFVHRPATGALPLPGGM